MRAGKPTPCGSTVRPRLVAGVVASGVRADPERRRVGGEEDRPQGQRAHPQHRSRAAGRSTGAARAPMFLEMAQWWTDPEADDSFLQFRERSVRDGSWLSLAVILIVLVYVLVGWEGRHRGTIVALLALGLAVTYVVTLLPAAEIVRSRWREAFFLAWSVGDLVLIAGIVGADGGSHSVLSAIFFLPLIFGSL